MRAAALASSARVDPALSGLPPLPPLPRAQPRSTRWQVSREAVVDALASTFAAGGGVAVPVWALLLPLRLVLAVGWLRAGWANLVAPGWFDGVGVRSFLMSHQGDELALMTSVVDGVLMPLAAPIAWVVVAAQLFCGLTLLVGRFLRSALVLGLAMSVTFALLGAVTPHAASIVMQLVLLLAVLTGAIGRSGARAWRPRMVVGVGFMVLAAVLGTFVRTLSPARLADDPAAVLATIAFVFGATIVLLADMHRRAAAAASD